MALAAALVAVAVALVPPALDNASENEADERAAIAASRERACGCGRDRSRARSAIPRASGSSARGDPRDATCTCLVERGGRGTYQGRELLPGYCFRGRVQLKSGSAAWCRENPPPLHADQEEFVKVPSSRECTS